MQARLVVGVVAACVAVCLMAAPASAQSTYTVSGTSDPSSPSCNGTVCQSLRAAVAAANADPGSTIQLGSATYTLSQAALTLSATMTITGDGPSATTIKQTTTDRVIFADTIGATVAITGVTITGGDVIGAAPSGAGMPGGDAQGGGIENYGTMTLTNVVLSGNTATGHFGGASFVGNGGDGGSAHGGAIATGDGTGDNNSLTLVATTVSGNVAVGGEGGFVRVSGAHAGGGGDASGAIFGWDPSTIVVRDSNVSGNQASGGAGGPAIGNGGAGSGGGGDGGGIFTFGGVLTITGSTIAGNAATGGSGGSDSASGLPGGSGGGAVGGGVEQPDSAGVFTLTGSTVANNTATGGVGGDATGGGNGGAGGGALGGGVGSVSAPATRIVNSTITGNRATGADSGSGATAGSKAVANGGGIGDDGAPVILASVTLANNSAVGSASSSGGNLYTDAKFADTIVAGGFASGTGGNCTLFGASVDNGHNLEDTSPSQCGLSSMNSDQLGTSAGLLALASNGGPTQTRALAAGSPALGSGGGCTDPSQMGSPALLVDQRGLPRPAGACDIGAYQLQPPGAAGAPQISGTPTAGQQIACSQGSWSGDQLAFAYQWLRDGTVPVATTAGYTVAANDVGHQLSCQVTASNMKGVVTQTSAPASVLPSAAGGGGLGSALPPVVSAVAETNRVWREANKTASLSRAARAPLGTTFSFVLDRPANVRLAFTKQLRGRMVGRRCVAQTRRNRHKRRCARTVTIATMTFAARAGTNKVKFYGRTSKRFKLPLGPYTLALTATNNGGTSKPKTLSFTIVH